MDNKIGACGQMRIVVEVEFFDQDVFRQTVDRVTKETAQSDPSPQSSTTVTVEFANGLPPVTDPTDRQILEWALEDPDLTDILIGQRLGISRQAVNPRRCKLKAMGYKVR